MSIARILAANPGSVETRRCVVGEDQTSRRLPSGVAVKKDWRAEGISSPSEGIGSDEGPADPSLGLLPSASGTTLAGGVFGSYVFTVRSSVATVRITPIVYAVGCARTASRPTRLSFA